MNEVRRLADQTIDEAIEAAYWQFDAMRKGLNEWAQGPKAERDAFKLVCWGLAKGVFPVPLELLGSASERDALAARVQAVEEINRFAAINLTDLEQRITQVVADKADMTRERDEAVTRVQDIVSALGFKRECWKAPSRGMDVVLEDAKRLRPEMAKARQRVREIEGSLGHWFDEEFLELNAGPSSEMLLRIWRKAKETAQQLAEAQRTIEVLHGRLSSAINAHHQAEQQVARLRNGLFVLKHEAQAVADDCHTPRYARLDEALESASTILRETGAGGQS